MYSCSLSGWRTDAGPRPDRIPTNKESDAEGKEEQGWLPDMRTVMRYTLSEGTVKYG